MWGALTRASLLVVLLHLGLDGRAAEANTRVLQVEFQPAADDLQIAVWLEDAAGNFQRTLFITRAVGTFGIGNRPGVYNLKSGFRWPYGRRTNALPVWAHRHGGVYPLIVFEDGRDTSVAYHEEDSSTEAYFCRPTRPQDQFCYKASDTSPCAYGTYPPTSSHGPAPPPMPAGLTVDAITCPTPGGGTLSKGRFDSGGATTVYPPRNDLTVFQATDYVDTRMYAALNTLDAVSRATPVSGLVYKVYAMADDLPDGEYVVWVEVNREFDPNDAYNESTLSVQHDTETEWDDFGAPNVGQPSVVWKVPVTIQTGQTPTAQVLDYEGYGSSDGASGDLNPPDSTISDMPGSGAGRLVAMSDGGAMYRVRVSQGVGRIPSDGGVPDMGTGGTDGGSHGDLGTKRDGSVADQGGPNVIDCSLGMLSNFKVVDASPGSVTLSFNPPSDISTIAEYDVRYRAGHPVADDFDGANPGPQVPTDATGPIKVTVGGLRPQTHYYFGIRARGICGDTSNALYTDVETPNTPYSTLQGCFVATAAHGTLMAPAVTSLRHLRDRVLLPSVRLRPWVGAYYVVSPMLAGYIAPDEDLRRAARSLLLPLVATARLLGVDR